MDHHRADAGHDDGHAPGRGDGSILDSDVAWCAEYLSKLECRVSFEARVSSIVQSSSAEYRFSFTRRRNSAPSIFRSSMSPSATPFCHICKQRGTLQYTTVYNTITKRRYGTWQQAAVHYATLQYNTTRYSALTSQRNITPHRTAPPRITLLPRLPQPLQR